MIRNLKIDDADVLQVINKEQLGYDFPLEATKSQLAKLLKDSSHHFFLGFEDELTQQIIGYVHAEVYEAIYANSLFNILALAVSKDKVNQGIGQELMTALEKEARLRNYAAIRLNSGVKRVEAHQFYERIGYKNDKMQKRFIKRLD